METLRLTDHLGSPVRVYAGFGSRVLAKLIDDALIAVSLLIFDLALRSPFLLGRSEQKRASIEGVIVFLVFCIYSALMESSKWQATFGKRTVGIVVMEVDGSRPSFVRSLLRVVVQCIPIGYLLAIFNARRQALHDIVAATVVVPGTL
ncbi:MAG TPA: RDD family protein [Terriglobales bacterium]|nr:RDD family protein [Terriglobales bacterium]